MNESPASLAFPVLIICAPLLFMAWGLRVIQQGFAGEMLEKESQIKNGKEK